MLELLYPLWEGKLRSDCFFVDCGQKLQSKSEESTKPASLATSQSAKGKKHKV